MHGLVIIVRGGRAWALVATGLTLAFSGCGGEDVREQSRERRQQIAVDETRSPSWEPPVLYQQDIEGLVDDKKILRGGLFKDASHTLRLVGSGFGHHWYTGYEIAVQPAPRGGVDTESGVMPEVVFLELWSPADAADAYYQITGRRPSKELIEESSEPLSIQYWETMRIAEWLARTGG